MTFGSPINQQVYNHIDSLLPDADWKPWFDFFQDDGSEGKNQFVIRQAGGSEDPLIGEPSFDLIAIGKDQTTQVPRAKLEEVSAYLLTNHKFGDIIHTVIVSGVRPTGMLSNNRPIYTMTINLLTNRTESQ